jgi:hypothetical protein
MFDVLVFEGSEIGIAVASDKCVRGRHFLRKALTKQPLKLFYIISPYSILEIPLSRVLLEDCHRTVPKKGPNCKDHLVPLFAGNLFLFQDPGMYRTAPDLHPDDQYESKTNNQLTEMLESISDHLL